MKSENQKYLFESASVSKAVLSLAVPTVIAQLITVVYNMADTFFIGQMGNPSQVAAATLAMPVFMFLTAFANLFGIGGSSVISRFLGAGRQTDASGCSAFCVWAGVFSSIIYGVLIWIFKKPVFALLGATAETYDYLRRYIFWTVVAGSMPTVMNTELAHLVRSEGYSREASFGVAFGGILNIALDPLFIFTFKMEITGAALATMLSNLCAVIYFLIFLFRIRKTTSITINPKMCESHQIKLPHKVADENRTPLYGAFFLPNPQFLYITLFFTGISNNFFVAENSENIFLMLRSPFCGNALCQHFFCRFQIFSMYPKKTTLHSAGGEFISSFEMSFRADFRFGLSGGG